MVLTVEAVEITAHCGDGKGLRTGEKVKNGLLFDGVYMGRAGQFVDEGIKGAVAVLAYAADTSFARNNYTVMSTEMASGNVIEPFFVKRGFFHDSPPR
jgi:hypothetical protein